MEELITQILSLGALFLTAIIILLVISLAVRSAGFCSDFLKKWGVQIIFVFSLISVVMSLTLSMGFDMIPCDLCWYQRIFMFPIVFISGLAWYKRDFRNGASYSMLLAVIGSVIALYNYLLQMLDSIKQSVDFCSITAAADCSEPEFIHFGFVTFPYLSLVAFIMIIILAYYAKRKD